MDGLSVHLENDVTSFDTRLGRWRERLDALHQCTARLHRQTQLARDIGREVVERQTESRRRSTVIATGTLPIFLELKFCDGYIRSLSVPMAIEDNRNSCTSGSGNHHPRQAVCI